MAMDNKSRLTAGILNFFLPGFGLAYLAGWRWGVFGILSWVTLLSLELGAFVGLGGQEMAGTGLWLFLVLVQSICSGILAASLAKR
jgi:hypothetical protein